MSEPKSDYQFPHPSDQYTTEQPIAPKREISPILPNPFDPIGNIETEGRALRKLASGQMPRWIVLTSWILFGFSSVVVLGIILHTLMHEFQQAIDTQEFGRLGLAVITFFLPVVFCCLILMILVRATWSKKR